MRAPSKLQLIWRSCIAVLLLCGAGALRAQTDDTAGDPPDRVARLSYLSGDVGLLPSGAQDWGEAGVNRPLTGGDRLSSAARARVELELDGATLRLDGQTDVGFLQLDDQLAQLELTQGSLNLTVRQLGDGQSYEIDTPTVALVVDQPGSFRIDIDGQATRVTAFDGSATVYGENDAQRQVVAGRSYRFADSALEDVALEDVGGGDEFDAWCEERDRRYADSESGRYVSEDVIGYQDLDQYGDWRTDPDYGRVWYPAHVDIGWAPYRDGHWAWVGPWGWTWVDDAPWGFAPYHYGRWAWRHDGWCWVPGPAGWRPVYAPALVAFVGGRHWNASVGTRPVGWFPLGPGEVYDPWYRGSRRYYTRVNVTNIHVHDDRRKGLADRINRRYGDWHRGVAPPVRALDHGGPRGFTAVPARDFAGADRVQKHRLKIDPGKLAKATVLTRDATPRPTPGSFVPRRPAQARPLPAQGFRREVVARHAPRMEMTVADRTAHPQAHTAAPGHVRVLRPRPATLPAVARIVPVDRARAGQDAAHAPAHLAPGHTVGGMDASARAPREAPLRPGELRSARFARPLGAAHDRADPRPGVSFISTSPSDRARSVRSAPTLPQVPRIERMDASRAPARRPGAAVDSRYQHVQDVEAQARAARIEAARRQAVQRTPAMPRGGVVRGAQPAHMRALDFDAQRARAAAPPQRFQRPPDFRAIRPMPQAAPAPRPIPPPAVQRQAAQPPAPQPRHEASRRLDRQH